MILILAEDYPSEHNKYALAYIHTRNLYYKKMGYEVNVLSFNAEKSYEYEGIKVITKSEYKTKMFGKNVNLVISHAPNLKNHIYFLMKNSKRFRNVVMIFHGHEVLKISKYYPKPYKFTKQIKLKTLIRDTYDRIKLPLMKKVIKKMLEQEKLYLVFVSNWMKENFLKNVKVKEREIIGRSYIISNSANSVFFEKSYKFDVCDKKADFVTIRPFDNPKYGVDIVRELAIKYSDLTFHIYGKGDFFNHFSKPPNVTVYNEYFSQTDLPDLLNKYNATLMPTRLDAQGVMVCEMATFGIPVITSDIDICKEMLSDFENVFFVNNETKNINLYSVLNEIKENNKKNLSFSDENTVQCEVDLIKKMMKGK